MHGSTLVGNNRKLSYVGNVEPACPRVWTLNDVSLAPTRKVYRLIRAISPSGVLASTFSRVSSRCRLAWKSESVVMLRAAASCSESNPKTPIIAVVVQRSGEARRGRLRRLCFVRDVKKHPRLKYPFAAIREVRRQRIPLTV